MFLPGKGAPEEWVWDRLRAYPDDFVAELGLNRNDLVRKMKCGDAHYASVAGLPGEIAKKKLYDLSKVVKHSVRKICRIVSRRETELIGSCREMEIEREQYPASGGVSGDGVFEMAQRGIRDRLTAGRH